MQHFISKLLTCLVFLTSPADSVADDILPVAQGRHSMAFVVGDKTARPPAGSWVAFFGTTHRDIPTMLRVSEGFVLGMSGNVVFVEVAERDAIALAQRQANQKIHLRKTREPDPEMVAERRRLAERSQPITLAPRLRTVSISAEISRERIGEWKPGVTLTFRNAREVNRLTYRDDRVTSHYYDIIAQFVSAVQTDASRFDISVIVKPEYALALSKADAERRISIVAEGEAVPEVDARPDPRCYITRRHTNERIRVEIPCT